MTTLQSQARALGDPTRHAIFRYIADAGYDVGVAELTARFELNHNAIRKHLAKLVAADLLVETKSAPTGPGRPRLLYGLSNIAEGNWGTAGPYERLSRLLLHVIRSGDPPEEVGKRAAPSFLRPSPSGDPIADVTAAMARQGFDPLTRVRRSGADIVLRRCPFAAAAAEDRAVVCGIHLGIADGLATSDDTAVAELVANDPEVANCEIRIRARDAVDTPKLTLRRYRGGSATQRMAPPAS